MDAFEFKKKNSLSIIVVIFLFILACFLQGVDDFIVNANVHKMVTLFSQFLFIGILVYWAVRVANSVSEKNIRIGLILTVSMITSLILIKLVKYNVIYNETAIRYLWYSYYIPHCLTPILLLLTVLNMARKKDIPLSKWYFLLFLPSLFLIVFVFTNDLHQCVFSFQEGLTNANDVYKWEWGYYLILAWIAGQYLFIGILLYIKCRISYCRKKAWLPLTLFAICLLLCVLRELFNPSFIKMPETVAFSILIVSESLIQIGLVPSNKEHASFFDVADVSAIILDKNLNVALSNKNSLELSLPDIKETLTNGECKLSRNLTLKEKNIKGGEVFYIEDSSEINKINDLLEETNMTLKEESDLILAENRLKEERSKIKEQNDLYNKIFSIARPRLERIKDSFQKAKTDEEKDNALRLALIYGTFIKRRSNLAMLEKEKTLSFNEFAYSLKESVDALSFYGIASSFHSSGDIKIDGEIVILAYDFFEECIEKALPNLSACLLNVTGKDGEFIFRLVLENAKSQIDDSWEKEKCQRLDTHFTIEKEDENLYVTFFYKNEEITK